jgi:hypothetical protein
MNIHIVTQVRHICYTFTELVFKRYMKKMKLEYIEIPTKDSIKEDFAVDKTANDRALNVTIYMYSLK